MSADSPRDTTKGIYILDSIRPIWHWGWRQASAILLLSMMGYAHLGSHGGGGSLKLSGAAHAGNTVNGVGFNITNIDGIDIPTGGDGGVEQPICPSRSASLNIASHIFDPGADTIVMPVEAMPMGGSSGVLDFMVAHLYSTFASVSASRKCNPNIYASGSGIIYTVTPSMASFISAKDETSAWYSNFEYCPRGFNWSNIALWTLRLASIDSLVNCCSLSAALKIVESAINSPPTPRITATLANLYRSLFFQLSDSGNSPINPAIKSTPPIMAIYQQNSERTAISSADIVTMEKKFIRSYEIIFWVNLLSGIALVLFGIAKAIQIIVTYYRDR
jgi:hypothetical protein